MQLGMIGLGRMGQNMVWRLTKAGHEVVVSDTKPEVIKETVDKGSGKAAGSSSLRIVTTPSLLGPTCTLPGFSYPKSKKKGRSAGSGEMARVRR